VLERLPSKCMEISFANSYFSGYYPQYMHKKLLNEGFSKEDIISLLSDDNFYFYNEVRTNLENAIQELKRQDTELDITSDNYIEKNYKI